MTPNICGLYVVTPQATDVIEKVAAAINGGARVVQFRDKHSDAKIKLAIACELSRLCREHGVLFLVNDDVELAKNSNADGVHIGKHDGHIQQIRALLPDGIIGVSCYNELARAIEAEKQGASYVAFGRFFPSQTKPDAIQAPLGLISQAKKNIRIPVVAIGGIDEHNAKSLIDEGVDAVAVIHAVFGANNIQNAASSIAKQFYE